MKKALLIMVILLAVAGMSFGLGSVTSTTAVDADANTLTETVATSISVAPFTFGVTIAPKFYLEDDKDATLPLTLTTKWQMASWVYLTGTYVNDNLNVDEPEDGTFTLVVGISF